MIICGLCECKCAASKAFSSLTRLKLLTKKKITVQTPDDINSTADFRGSPIWSHVLCVNKLSKKLVTSSDRSYVACVSAIVLLPKLLAAAMSTYGGR